MPALTAARTRTSKALAGLELPACFAQATVASAANAYSRTTGSAKASRRRLMSKVERVQAAEFVAFGSWRCNCTLLATTLDEVPSKCPTHGVTLLGPAEWTTNPNGCALGLQPDHRLAGAEVVP